ncbi:hypothetical protein DERP_006537 [Dermatophagoides pteronyssinus]|uniref:Uncharacterized protein n=1 Tax=Dermatophagoides pteronyssinus TaxID=6956 RepID=A0ABQ8IR42_DERPT|nr:hypothetical protein DERP_006537 [Dermatophagoides pteronyssinus]
MRITIEDLQNKQAWDTVQVYANYLNHDQNNQIYSWSNYFWPQPLFDQLINIPYGKKNGCDYAFCYSNIQSI